MAMCYFTFHCFFCFFFFFFQAEDGIRDHCLTGVQTCALPIWDLRAAELEPADGLGPSLTLVGADGRQRVWLDLDTGEVQQLRSEERRVGKECRSRWWPDP